MRAATTPTSTIIALHGGPGLSHEYMRPFEVLASPTTQVAMFDQRGTGRSTRPTRGGLTFGDHADDIEHLRVHLGADRIDLVGHSYGGVLAMAYAIRYPAKVRSLILVDTMPPKYGDYLAGQWYFSEAMVEHASAGHVPRSLPGVEGDDCSKRLIALLPIYFHDKQHPMTKHLAGSTCHEAVGNETRAANEHYDLHDGLEALEIATLIVHGISDPFRRQMADATAAALARSKPRLEILEGCGHVPFEECGRSCASSSPRGREQRLDDRVGSNRVPTWELAVAVGPAFDPAWSGGAISVGALRSSRWSSRLRGAVRARRSARVVEAGSQSLPKLD